MDEEEDKAVHMSCCTESVWGKALPATGIRECGEANMCGNHGTQ